MKNFPPLVCLLALVCCTGCFDVTEEYWFNKDRSGRYEFNLDMSTMGGFMSLMQNMAPNDSTGARPDMPKDTLIRLSTLPDSVKNLLPHPALLEHVQAEIKMQDAFRIKIGLDFQDVAQVEQLWQNFSAMTQRTPGETGAVGGMAVMYQSLVSATTRCAWSGKTLELRTSPVEREEDAGLTPFGSVSDNPMLGMMFANNKYRQILHFSSGVRTVKGKNLRRDGKDVSAVYPLTDVIKNPEILSCSIKVKR